jgi:hypothetical protein
VWEEEKEKTCILYSPQKNQYLKSTLKLKRIERRERKNIDFYFPAA